MVAAVGHAAHDLLEVRLAGRGVLAGLALHDVVDAAEAEAARAHAGALAALGVVVGVQGPLRGEAPHVRRGVPLELGWRCRRVGRGRGCAQSSAGEH